MISEEQFDWLVMVGGMQQDGLSWTEAMALCRSTKEMPDSVYNWLIERKKRLQTISSHKQAEAF